MKRTLIAAVVLTIAIAVAASPVLAGSAGWLDRTYATGGTHLIRPPSGGWIDRAWSLTYGWDGGVIAAATGGIRRTADTERVLRIESLTRDGRRDSAFSGGSVDIHFGHRYVAADAIQVGRRQTDGSLLVLIGWLDSGISGTIRMMRILRSGVVDAAYEGRHQAWPYGHSDQVRMVILADGRVRACHSETDESGLGSITLRGLTADGSPDLAVGPDGVRRDIVPGAGTCEAMTTDAAGRLVVGSLKPGIPGETRSEAWVARLSPDGQLDAAFGRRGITSLAWAGRLFYPTHIRVAGDGSIYLGGNSQAMASDFNPVGPTSAFVARATSSGLIDRSFGYGGVYRYAPYANTALTALDVTTQGRYVVGVVDQTFTSDAPALLYRGNGSTGRLDPTFGKSGRVVVPGETPRILTTSFSRLITIASRPSDSPGTTPGSVVVQRRRG